MHTQDAIKGAPRHGGVARSDRAPPVSSAPPRVAYLEYERRKQAFDRAHPGVSCEERDEAIRAIVNELEI